MADTIYTKVINREIPADILYEDEKAVAFLDINPVHKGHTLVVPREPFANVFDADLDVLAHMMKVAGILSPIIKEAVNAEGINLILNNGEAAGQMVMDHAHLHVIPRHKDDGTLEYKYAEGYEEGEKSLLGTQIVAALEHQD